jgi:hypothetical protein
MKYATCVHRSLIVVLVGGIAACGGSPSQSPGPPQQQDAAATSDATTSDAPTSGDEVANADDSAEPMEADVASPVEATIDAAGVDGGPPGVAPTTLDFGMASCGSSTPAAPQTFRIYNPSTASVTWTAALGKGANSAFTLAPAMGILTPGQSAPVTVTPLVVPQASSTASNGLGDVVDVTLNNSSVNVTLQETAKGAVLVFNPASAMFGSTPLGSPLTTYFEVENVGNVSLSDVTLTLTGDPSFTLPGGTISYVTAPVDGGATSEAGADAEGGTTVDAGTSTDAGAGADATTSTEATETEVVDAGASPRSSVTFSPTSTTPVTGSVAIGVGASDTLCAPLPPPLALSGTGTNGKVVVSPASLIASPDGVNQMVPCGQAALPMTVTIQNIGNAPFTWTATLLHGNGTFYTVSPTSGPVGPMASVPVTITPKVVPATSSTAPDAFADTLTITTTAALDVPHTVALHETAQGAIISRSLNSLNFGNVANGTTSTQTYTFSNTGNVNATLTLTNGDTAFVQTTPLLASAGAGVFTTESVSFQPTLTQTYSDIALLALQTPVPLCGTLPGNLSLSGNGTNPSLTATPSTLNFGSIPCGTAALNTQTVNVTNNGPATTFSAVLLKGAGSYFSINPTSGNMTAGGIVPIVVTGNMIPSTASTSSNAFGDTLQVTTGTNNVADVTLNMTALGAVLAFSKANIAFTATPPNTPVTSPLTVNNTGNAPVTVTLVPSLGVFTTAPVTGAVPAGTMLPVTASFDPTSITPPSYSGTLSMTVPMGAYLCGPLPMPIPLTGTAN